MKQGRAPNRMATADGRWRGLARVLVSTQRQLALSRYTTLDGLDRREVKEFHMRTPTELWRPVLVGTLAASLVLNFGETLLHGVIMAGQWQSALALLGKTLDASLSGWLLIFVGNTIHCVALVGLGALLERQSDSTLKLAGMAGAAVWAVGWLAPVIGAVPLGLFPLWMWGVVLGVGSIELVVAAFCGLWVYRRMSQMRQPSGTVTMTV